MVTHDQNEVAFDQPMEMDNWSSYIERLHKHLRGRTHLSITSVKTIL